jgi:glycine/D-amino acid oxidase-like deaminating enzyme
MKALYHPALYDVDRPVASYWEASAPPPDPGDRPLAGDEACEVAVIGGGYTGLSTALHLARDHGIEVRLLEAGRIGWGASGRNGGFCCLPATKLSIEQLIARYGLEEAKRFFATQLEGMELVRALGRDEVIDFDLVGDGNLEVAHRPAAFPHLEKSAEALTGLFGIATRLYSREEFREVGHDSTEQFGALHMAAGFALHPLKFAAGLGRAAARHGAVLHPNSEVLDWSRNRDGRHVLTTAGGCLKARRVVMATNGYTREGMHPAFDKRLLPALSNILTTRPLSAAELAAQSWHTQNPICNSRDLLFYYRLLPDRRFLFGARGDTTGRPEDGEKMKRWMTRRLGEVFPAWRDVEIDYFWRGLACVTRKLSPSVGRLEDDPSVWYGYGYHANGVNTAPWTGMMLARMIAGANRGAEALPAIMAGPPPKFPLAALRLWLLRGALLYHRLTDGLG